MTHVFWNLRTFPTPSLGERIHNNDALYNREYYPIARLRQPHLHPTEVIAVYVISIVYFLQHPFATATSIFTSL